MNWASPHDSLRRSHGCLLASIACLALAIATPTVSADRADDFLAALRQRGWHDVAREYLESADQDPLATDDFLARVDYELGVTYRELARQSASQGERTAQLNEAAASLARFADGQRESPLYLQALTEIGNLRSEQAQYALQKARQLPTAAGSERDGLLATARQLIDDAREPLERCLSDAVEDLTRLPKAAAASKDPRFRGARQRLEGKQAEARFLLAKLDFDQAQTYAPNSDQRTAALDAAAKAFAKLYEDYDEKLVGFYGRLYEGRCYQEAGQLDEALNCYEDLIDQPPIASQDFRRLVARAFRHRAECHLAENDFDDVIEECNQWLDESRPAEQREPEWLAVAFRLAAAYQAKAADPGGSRDASRLRSDARRLLRDVAKHPNEFQREARAQLTASRSAGDSPVTDVKTFGEAFAAGKDALERMNSSKLTARLAQENNPGSVEDLREQAQDHQREATQYFEAAVRLAEPQSQLEELLACRYYLCWLYWEDDRLHDAAVVGEFLARRYPENKFAPVAAKVALAANERLYNTARQSGTDDAQYEAERLAAMAELLVSRWPESREAAAATNLLLNIALRENRFSDAQAMLARLPDGNRAAAELSLGGSLWTRYLQRTADKTGDVDESVARLKQRAAELLARGYEQLRDREERPSTTEANAVLYYAQLLLSEGQSQRAVEVLEDKQVGPLSLVKQGTAAARQPAFVVEAYKAGLRAYVSVQPPRREDAQRMIEALESSVRGDGAQQQLTGIFVGLGLQLQRQIRDLTAAGRSDQARSVATAFEDLLAHISARSGTSPDWKIQNWIAQTSLQLGESLRGEDARRYLEQAERALAGILASAERDPAFAPSPLAVLGVRKRLGDCLRAQEKFADALEQYTAVLAERPNMLQLQLAAADALQRWGTVEKNVDRLEESIRGAKPQANRKNLIWGWLRVAAIADQQKRKAQQANEPARQPLVVKYHDLFFQARYNAAKARFAAAQLVSGADRQRQLRTARQSVESMKQLYPDLGGPTWETAYLDLLEDIKAAIEGKA